MEGARYARYYWGCCFICRKIGSSQEPLKRCSRCKLFYYCSSEHQRTDWNSHKEFCMKIGSVLQATGAQDLFEDSSEYAERGSEWFDFRVRILLALSSLLHRPLYLWEHDALMFPKVCHFCFRKNLQDMVDCATCMCVTYCSVQHQQLAAAQHELYCSELKCAILADNFLCTSWERQPSLPSHLSDTFLPPSGNVLSILNAQLQVESKLVVDNLQVRLLSDILTAPLSILYVGYKFGLGSGKTLVVCTDLCIHIVGANLEEMKAFRKWEYMLHRLPALKTMRLVFVGLEMGFEEEGVCQSVLPCNACAKLGRNLIYEVRKRAYHEYAISDDFTGPDLVCAFNCGFHEIEDSSKDTWKLSMPFLVKLEGVPLMFTSYTKKEADKDLNYMKRNSSVPIVVQAAGENNPCRSHLPMRDSEWTISPEVYYKNQYFTVVRSATAEGKCFNVAESGEALPGS